MNCGLVSKWDILEFKCELTAAYTRSGTQGVSAAAELLSTYAETAIALSTGIWITCTTEIANGAAAGAGTGQVRVRIPSLGIDETENYTGGWQTSLTGRIEADDVALYVVFVPLVGYCWGLYFSELRVYAGGTLKHTEPAGSIINNILNPAGIPLIGVPPRLSASSAVNPVPTLGSITATCALSHTYASADADGDGGYRFKEAGSGSWSAPPVNVDIEAIPAVTCGVTVTPVNPTAADTWTGHVEAHMSTDDETTRRTVTDCNLCSNGTGTGWEFWAYDRVSQYQYWGASVMLLPALSKSVKRWGDGTDYRALIGRTGFPWTKRVASADCFDYVLSASTDSDSVTVEVHPEYSELISTVENAAHTIEDPLGETSFAPYTVTGFKYRGRATCTAIKTVGSCPLVLPEEPEPDPPVYCHTDPADAISHTVASQFEPLVQESSGVGGNPDMLGHLDHLEADARYINYVCHPHWSYEYWFPPNTEDTDGDGEPDKQSVWQLFLDDIELEYWLDLRTQWISHPSLPGGEDLRTRNSLISAPLRDGALSYFIRDSVWGLETSWWGITRFQRRQFSPVTEKTLDSDSASLWSADHATLTHGANITVNPDQATCTVYLDLGSATVEWWYYVHLAKRIMVDWIATNVASVSVYLDSIDGSSSVLLATATGTYDWPLTGEDLMYAGSWAQDFGCGYAGVDEGADSLVSGISSVTMTDAERVLFFLLLAGQLARRLRFEIEVVDHTVDMTLKYPKFVAPTTEPYVYQEQGHHACIVWADGPGIRYGSWRWYDYDLESVLTSPAIDVPGCRFGIQGHKSSVLDALRWENLTALAKSYDDGIATTLTGLYDTIEGQTQALAAKGTIAFLVKSNAKAWSVLVNTWAEVPPLACFPVRARDSDLAATGSFVQESWSFAQSPRDYVSAKQEINVYDGSGTAWTSAASSPASWERTRHEHAVDNSEGRFDIKVGSKRIAVMRPWHGCFAVPKVFDSDVLAGAPISSDTGLDRRHVNAWIDSGGNVFVSVEDHALSELDVTDLGFAADWVHIKIDRSSRPTRVRLYTEEAGTIYVRESTDGGRVFGSASAIGTGERVTADISLNGTEFVYWIDGTAIKGRRYDRGGNALEAEFTAVASGVDSAAIAATFAPILDGESRVVLRYVSGGVRTYKTSPDGITFS